MSTSSQTRISVLAGIVVMLIIYSLAPGLVTQPHGVVLPAAHTFPATAVTEVQVLPSMSAQYKQLGFIRVQLNYTKQSFRQASTQLINYAKKLAATVGANGLVVQYMGHPQVSSMERPHWLLMAQPVLRHYTFPQEPGIVLPSATRK
jgi:hypothetical protein